MCRGCLVFADLVLHRASACLSVTCQAVGRPMKEVFVRGTSPRTHCLRRTPTPLLPWPLHTLHQSRSSQTPASSASNSVTAAGEISLRHAGNEGLERTEEEAYVLITNLCRKVWGRKGRVCVWNHFVFNDDPIFIQSKAFKQVWPLINIILMLFSFPLFETP